ncbi:beta-1,3-galactosyltransferase 1-like isoform X1 [Haliotis cracherodii]|uniref:beta-1,3-galactosyltransferase 1-like isoform X1 n=2 Tax=Haliotis cracherodii TaxID=6455 RepID=UPI0039E7F7D0
MRMLAGSSVQLIPQQNSDSFLAIMEVVRNTPPIRTIYLLSLLLCVAIVAAYYVGCRHRREVFLDLYIDGVSVDAVLKNAGVGEDGSLEIVVAVPHPSDTITRLKRKGVAVKKLVKQIPEVTKTSYPLTMDTPYVINNPNICTNISNLKFLVIVHSATQNFQRRRLIRETWANKNLFKDLSVRILFLFGITQNEKVQSLIENESLVYEDIVQGNFLDTYHNLTHKGVLSFRWISEHCLHAQMVLKVDDDMFINPFLLLEKYYPILKSKQRHILCHLRTKGSSPIVRGTGKWKVEDDQFKGYSHYPVNYCNGYVVLISTEIIRAMYRASYMTPFFWVDDVYLYGLLPLKAGGVTHDQIRHNMTLNVNTGIQCYTKTKKCQYLAVNAWKDGAIETLWYAALQQITPQMRKEININVNV